MEWDLRDWVFIFIRKEIYEYDGLVLTPIYHLHLFWTGFSICLYQKIKIKIKISQTDECGSLQIARIRILLHFHGSHLPTNQFYFFSKHQIKMNSLSSPIIV
jgi:hypothetical protein